ncbi:MAG TPA: 16S rRNA (guanine(527)-N(7))-methyltransferase RsmG [Noviherbaspirillum sp.]|jgi:16S rRNA (guanine527-N7)-methyltransferase|uniref:16S rRNA (guanine(527)-N(7))-methyltransferase RsmG n=1 Tax=Noviherbaspirillum sp. TaxID=1926288 RepID=UPI002F946FCF
MNPVDRERLSQRVAAGAATLQLDLAATQLEQLQDYLQLLVKWNAVYNLTAVRDPEQMVTQHLLDSLAAVPAFAGARRVLDVGAGGGLPGIVLAVARPDMDVALVDTVHKKTAFLTQVKAELRLSNVTVHTARVEQLQVQQPFDVITSRAFAELKDFITWSGHLLAPHGCFIALKGVRPDDEISRLPQGWTVTQVQPIVVPGLDAERHLITIRPNGGQP